MARPKGAHSVHGVDLHCPKHKDEVLRRMFTAKMLHVKKTSMNKRGKRGLTTRTSWFFCEKCDKPYKLELKVRLLK